MDSTEVTIYLKNGTSHVIPRANLANYVRMQDFNILRVDYGDNPLPATSPDTASQGDTKESLIGHLIENGKINAKELTEWIQGCNSAEQIMTVLKGEKRKTVIAAGKSRINELL